MTPGPAVAIALPRPGPVHAPIEGRYCRLDPADPAQAEALFAAHARDETGATWTFLPYGPFEDAAALRAWMVAACTGTDPLFLAIATPQHGPVGLASFLRIDPANGVIEIGHLAFSPLLQRTPAATETLYLMLCHVFDDLGYRRCEWKCDARNLASRRAAERLGFAHEGTFRQAAVVKGRNRDTAWYALLDCDWPARRSALELWLDPANFDAAGHQRQPLAR